MRFGRFALRCAFLGAGLLVLTAPARANGRFPSANQIVASPTTPSLLVLRTTFGILVSQDGATTWDWICEKSVGYGGTEDPSMGLSAAGTFLAGTFEGLATSGDKGCSWAFVPGKLTQNVVVDLVVRPDAPATAMVLTNKFKNADDAGDPSFQSDIYLSTDDGKTWGPLGPSLDSSVVFETLEVAASDPKRLYVSGVRGRDATQKGIVLVSKDTGATWMEYTVPLDPSTERAPFVSAVDPKNPDRVYVRTAGAKDAPSRLLVSDDGAQTFREVLKATGEMQGFALSSDGQKVYAGGPKDGLFVANATDLNFVKKSPIAIQCLGVSGATLFACSNELGGFILGASQDDGATFTAKLHLYGVRGPLQCGPGTTEQLCVADWPALRDTLGTPPADAGVTDGAANDGGTSGGGGGKGCSCDATPGSGDSAVAMGVTAFAAAMLLRKKRRR